jgi:hypothetical protein
VTPLEPFYGRERFETLGRFLDPAASDHPVVGRELDGSVP